MNGECAASCPRAWLQAAAQRLWAPPTLYALRDKVVDSKALSSAGPWKGLADHDVVHSLIDGQSGIGAWAATDHHATHGCWIQMDLGTRRRIVGVETQGRQHRSPLGPQWVKRYRTFQSDDGVVWDAIGTFDGNFDETTRVRNFFPAPVAARYLRLVPLEHNVWPSLRWDVLLEGSRWG